MREVPTGRVGPNYCRTDGVAFRPSATDKKFRVRERISPRVFGSLVYKSFLTERAFPEEKIYKSSLIERAFPETARRRRIFLIFNF